MSLRVCGSSLSYPPASNTLGAHSTVVTWASAPRTGVANLLEVRILGSGFSLCTSQRKSIPHLAPTLSPPTSAHFPRQPQPSSFLHRFSDMPRHVCQSVCPIAPHVKALLTCSQQAARVKQSEGAAHRQTDKHACTRVCTHTPCPQHYIYQSASLCFQGRDFSHTKPNSLFAPEVFGALSLPGTTLLHSLTLGRSAHLPDSDSGQAPCAALSSDQYLLMSGLVCQTRPGRL